MNALWDTIALGLKNIFLKAPVISGTIWILSAASGISNASAQSSPPDPDCGMSSRMAFFLEHWPFLAVIAALIGVLTVSLILLRSKNRSLSRITARNRLLLSSAGEGICSIDIDGITTFVNPAALKMLGYENDELIGKNLHARTHHTYPDGRPYPDRDCPIWMTCKDGSIHRRSDEFFYRKDGSAFPVNYSSRPIIDRGEIRGSIVCFQDIRDLKQAEQELIRANDHLRTILDKCPFGVVVIGRDRRIRRANHYMSNLIGLENVSELCGATCDMYLCDSLQNDCPILDRHETIDNSERILRRSDGREIPILKSVIEIEISGEPVLLETFVDITHQKQADETIRKISAAVENSPVTIVITDSTGNIEYVNPKFTDITGYSREEAIGQNPRILQSGDFPAENYKTLWDTILSGRAWKGEFHNRKKNGELFWELASISPIRDVRGVITHFVAVKEDITERKLNDEILKKSREKLQKAKEEAEELNLHLKQQTRYAERMAAEAKMANTAKSEFLANMSHEIRTPINGVIGMTGLLLDTDLTEEQRQYAEVVRSSAESLLGLINDILDFSKIEAGKLELENLDFDLQNLLEDFASTLALRAHDKGLELLCSTDPEVPLKLTGDPGRLRQILTNLTGNAVKFTDHGEVAVHVQVADIPPAAQDPSRPDDAVLLRFTVRDTGIGIPEEKRDLIFANFTQADASTTRRFGGTGLGLAISKQLAELMGGEIGVSSQMGKGSTFWFTVKLKRRPDNARSEKIVPVDLNQVRILIVDDNATNRRILTALLCSWGMRPSEVPDGPSAIAALHRALAETDPFRIALIDMQMPDMNGEVLGKSIKADPVLSAASLVMLTSMGSRGDVRRLEKIGFSGYLNKPVRQQELKNVLSLALADRKNAPSHRSAIITRHSAREILDLFSGNKVRILLAEDNITNQQVALGILKKLGLRADAVANGAEVLKVLETIPYDLILMDVQMPVMDGLEATRMIRKMEAKNAALTPEGKASRTGRRPVPVIALTAHAIRGDREICLEAGMNDYITKPISPLDLADRLEKWLPKRQKTAESIPETPCVESPSAGGDIEVPVWDRPGMLKRLMGDEPLLTTVLKGFLSDIPLQIQSLKGFLETGDIAAAERQAHTIKGASANVGAECLRKTAGEMENAAKDKDGTAADALLSELEKQFERFRGACSMDISA